MTDFDTALKGAASAVLKRELTDEERAEFRDLADTLGMGSVEDYLYMLMIFKRNEDRIDGKLDAVAALDKKINETLESSIHRIFGEGAARIGVEMSEKIAAGAKGVLSSFGEYRSIRGQIILTCFICVLSAIAYRLGEAGVLNAVTGGSMLETILFLPAGWSVFFCGATYTFLWAGDNWNRIKETALYKIFLGGQILFLLILGLALL